MSQKKSKFVIRIAGENNTKDLKPEKMRAKDLAEVIVKFDDALSALVKEQMGEDFGGISITSITKGSINLSFSAEPIYDNAFDVFGGAIAEKTDFARSTYNANSRTMVRRAIDELEQFNLTHNTNIELKKNKKSQPVAIIKKAIPPAIPEQSEVAGETVLYGKVVGITGTERIKATLKLISGDTIEFHITSNQVKEFGRRYNEIIGLKGKAIWELTTNKVVKFEPEEVMEYTEESPQNTFASIRNQFAEVFDEIIDVEQFVRGQREE